MICLYDLGFACLTFDLWVFDFGFELRGCMFGFDLLTEVCSWV